MKHSIKKQLEQNSNWSEIKTIIQKISHKGFQVFVVGGAVRDALLKKKVKEIDLSSSAQPKEIKKLFPKALTLFQKYGVVTIPLQGKANLEIVTFREDSRLSDGRRPQSIQYSNLETDSKRRDFTINALYYDLKTDQVIDLVNGIKSLKEKKIKSIGKAKERFQEDHLRMLRALRFALQLDFNLDRKIKPAVFELKQNITKISKERITKELNKMFSYKEIKVCIESLKDYGLFEFIFPDLNFKKIKSCLTLYQQSFSDLQHIAPEKALEEEDKDQQSFSDLQHIAFYWAVLGLADFYRDKKGFSDFLKKYHLSSRIQKESLSYLKSVEILTNDSQSLPSKLIAFNGKHKQAYELSSALLNSKIIEKESIRKNKKKNLQFYWEEFKKRECKGKLPLPLVTGADLLKITPPIKKQNFSKILEKLYHFQLNHLDIKKKRLLKEISQTFILDT